MKNVASIAYVACMYTREILVFRLEADSGDITPIQSLPLNGAVLPLAVSPDRRFLYAALRSKPYGVASLAIDPSTGMLTHLADTPVVESMPYLSVDRSGRYLLGATNAWHGSKPRESFVSVSPIGTDGIVQAAQQVLATREKAHCVLTSPSNQHVYVSSCDGDVMVCSQFDAASGTLSDGASTSFGVDAGAGPRHFVFHPNHRILYLLNEYDATICAFVQDAATGTLEKIQTCQASPPDPDGGSLRAADIHVTPQGTFLYASVRSSNTLAAFKVDRAGLLTPLATYQTENEPRGFNIDPCGRYLLVAGRQSDTLAVFAIDEKSGELNMIGRHAIGLDAPSLRISSQRCVDLPPMKPQEHGLRGPNWVEFVSLGSD